MCVCEVLDSHVLLPVDDDRIGGRLVSIATTFLLAAATDGVETGKQECGKVSVGVGGEGQQH